MIDLVSNGLATMEVLNSMSFIFLFYFFMIATLAVSSFRNFSINMI